MRQCLPSQIIRKRREQLAECARAAFDAAALDPGRVLGAFYAGALVLGAFYAGASDSRREAT